MNKFKATTNDEIERLKNQLKWQVRQFASLLSSGCRMLLGAT